MAKMKESEFPVVQRDMPDTTQLPATRPDFSFENMFSRATNSGAVVRSITFKKLLTRPLISIAHQRELLFKCAGEIYTQQLTLKGRTEKDAPASMIDGVNVETGEEVSLVCNAMIVGALTRAGSPLAGRTFAMRSGDIKADKAYRVVDVVEVEVTS